MCPPLNGGSKDARRPHHLHNLVGSWDISVAIKPDVVCVAGANELVLLSTWGLSSPNKQVSRSSTPYWKTSWVLSTESECWPIWKTSSKG